MAEEWRIIAGFPDYAVSSEGRVKRLVPDARNHTCRVLRPYLNNKGYEVVTLSGDSGLRKRLVNRLVCTAFHGPAPAGRPDAAHNDGDRLNNRESNLRWASRSENMEDSRRHGTMAVGERHGRTTKPERTPRGEQHGHAKLTDREVAEIRNADRTIGSGRALAKKYGVSPATICIIRSGKTWVHTAQEHVR